MGYDDDECIVCYLYESGDDEGLECVPICFSCMAKLVESGQTTNRVLRGLSTHLKNGYIGAPECFLCKETVCVAFESPCCACHKEMFLDSSGESSSESSGEDSICSTK